MRRTDALRVLGLPNNATPDQIRKTYHTLARQFHPDKAALNGIPADRAKSNFISIKNAFECLREKEKEKEKERGKGRHVPVDSDNASDDIELESEDEEDEDEEDCEEEEEEEQDDTPDDKHTRSGAPPSAREKRTRAPRTGARKPAASKKQANHTKGRGRKSKNTAAAERAFEEATRGRYNPTEGSTARRYAENTYVDIIVPLRDIYTGTTVAYTCESGAFNIKILPGAPNGTKITYQGRSVHNRVDHAPGDLVFTVVVPPDPAYTRAGTDLAQRVCISLESALCGDATAVQTIDGRTIRVPHRGVVAPGSVISVDGEGFAHPRTGGKQRGRLNITFDVVFPGALTPEQKQLIKNAQLA
jgi:DnaJ-class molecular chaperone